MPEVSPSMLSVFVFMLSWPFFMLSMGRGRAESHRAGVLAPFSQQPGLTCFYAGRSATLTFCLCVCFRAYGARARWDGGEWSPLSCMGRVCLCWPACEPDLLIATLKRRLKRILRDKTVSIFPAALSAADVTRAMLTCQEKLAWFFCAAAPTAASLDSNKLFNKLQKTSHHAYACEEITLRNKA